MISPVNKPLRGMTRSACHIDDVILFDGSTTTRKDPEQVAIEQAAAQEAADAFQAKYLKYTGLTEEEKVAALAECREWLCSPAGDSGLDVRDTLEGHSRDDIEDAWLALTALKKNNQTPCSRWEMCGD